MCKMYEVVRIITSKATHPEDNVAVAWLSVEVKQCLISVNLTLSLAEVKRPLFRVLAAFKATLIHDMSNSN